MKKEIRFWLPRIAITLSGVAIALVAVNNYDKPANPKYELKEKRKELAQTAQQYERVSDYVIQEAEESMPDIEELRHLQYWENAYTGKDSVDAQKRIAQLQQQRDSIVSEKMNNDVQLARTSATYYDLMQQIESLQRDSVKRSEIAQRTLAQQWHSMCRDFHTKRMTQHQKRLKQLQKVK